MKLVARLHKCSSCIHSMASRSWCQITPLIQSCIVLSGVWPPVGQTAAARNAPRKYLENCTS